MKNLFEKTTVNNMQVKNRFIRAATWDEMAEDDGHINNAFIQRYENLAKGGVGLILTGYAFISKDEKPNPFMSGIYDDSFIEEYKILVDKVHKYETKIAMQIVYGGSQSEHANASEMYIYGPSAIKNIVSGITPKEATKDDIKVIVAKFGDAAVRVKKAGFDAVEIHAAHGYLLSQFLTPYYNRRTDEYGGAIHNRARIIYEVISEIRKRVGTDYPIMIKINFDDFMDKNQGLSKEESIEVFKRIDKLGIDMIEPSAVNLSSGEGKVPFLKGINTVDKQSYFKEAVMNIASVVNAKVILVGGNKNIDLMNEILNTTQIQYFSLSRTLLCEPDLINKWSDNKNYNPKCVSCNKCWDEIPNSCIFNR
ncbi:NADH:flavin oxidoreductase [Clostridium estertheticum]|uniref:NADH:flavin oxidoreductase n=1 Tax=Clostridium estertheticum TaxID=238834 RepID=A0A5N7IJI3_9CLOT|nr:NADH:flavin oxidoreductase [Clostridium estertheticum]MPQ30431.1 NADH:flavin oxidoreductase [Clostridium estertheticum]MPQ61107.1 NADH:flavin oxidoreductase [Clostridium estertheticum]